MNPDKNFNDAADRYATSPSIENSIALAQEFFNKGLFTEARDLYLSCLKGIHTDDPVIIVGLIRCEFELKNFEEVKARLDKLIEKKPDYKNQEAHLLYARALESLHDTDSAQHEYETLHGYFSGPDASFYFAKFLKSTKQTDKAISIFQHILDTAKRSSKFYNTNHQEIIRQTRVELKH
ncbi:MAG: hypothetical protein COA42_24445 [Alteromonadaceae bacterium]|nr:MAG: hypothetical protein COA42_24445 [Alteromonadaceae bacterium]